MKKKYTCTPLIENIAVTEHTDGLFSATITPNWTVNGNANGGYLMALAAHAMIQKTEKKGPSHNHRELPLPLAAW